MKSSYLTLLTSLGITRLFCQARVSKWLPAPQAADSERVTVAAQSAHAGGQYHNVCVHGEDLGEQSYELGEWNTGTVNSGNVTCRNSGNKHVLGE